VVYLKKRHLLPSTSKYFYRLLTSRMPKHLLFWIVQWYIPKWLPIDNQIRRIPKIGNRLTLVVPCWNYSKLPLSPQQVVEWGILDTYDALSATDDQPQTFHQVSSWFQEAGLANVRIREGGNGIAANGCRLKD